VKTELVQQLVLVFTEARRLALNSVDVTRRPAPSPRPAAEPTDLVAPRPAHLPRWRRAGAPALAPRWRLIRPSTCPVYLARRRRRDARRSVGRDQLQIERHD